MFVEVYICVRKCILFSGVYEYNHISTDINSVSAGACLSFTVGHLHMYSFIVYICVYVSICSLQCVCACVQSLQACKCVCVCKSM